MQFLSNLFSGVWEQVGAMADSSVGHLVALGLATGWGTPARTPHPTRWGSEWVPGNLRSLREDGFPSRWAAPEGWPGAILWDAVELSGVLVKLPVWLSLGTPLVAAALSTPPQAGVGGLPFGSAPVPVWRPFYVPSGPV